MSFFWILLVCTCLKSVHLQYIHEGPSAESDSGVLDAPQYYPNAFNKFLYSAKNDNELENVNDKSYYAQSELDAKSMRRLIKPENEWMPNIISTDDKISFKPIEREAQGIEGIATSVLGDDNMTRLDIMAIPSKKNFSPWGGKRSKLGAAIEHSWNWKRSESNMPKRVRFSPWGGKRNGQMILKPGLKNSKLIFSSSIPEVSRLFGLPSPDGLKNLEDYRFIPMLDKRHPIKILALSTQSDKSLREALPFRSFMEALPKIFKPGHPYADVSVKKDGKRKVKFSAWGGKRSPPIIGPIWTPGSHDMKDATLNAIVIIRNLAPKLQQK